MTPNPPLASVGGQATTVNTHHCGHDPGPRRPRRWRRATRGWRRCAAVDAVGGLRGEHHRGRRGEDTRSRGLGWCCRPRTPPGGAGAGDELGAHGEGDFPGTLDSGRDPTRGRSFTKSRPARTRCRTSAWRRRRRARSQQDEFHTLVSGSKAWVRVRAKGSAGPGAVEHPAVRVGSVVGES